MPTYKIVYFSGRGRAELSRLIFIASGTAFEDERINDNDWPSGINFLY
jgi:glutathione S-transferase